ncbi:MAG: hypothetical protein LBC65_06350, partial [Oscillospiraceae bacterium]|nr:hypothetical protein [Oscillospiraceae bacterium]
QTGTYTIEEYKRALRFVSTLHDAKIYVPDSALAEVAGAFGVRPHGLAARRLRRWRARRSRRLQRGVCIVRGTYGAALLRRSRDLRRGVVAALAGLTARRCCGARGTCSAAFASFAGLAARRLHRSRDLRRGARGGCGAALAGLTARRCCGARGGCGAALLRRSRDLRRGAVAVRSRSLSALARGCVYSSKQQRRYATASGCCIPY